MFPYYGSKSQIISRYPKPLHSLIIEPFAGSARYALKYFDRDVLLVDKYDVVVKIWKWLQLCSEKDIMSLPILKTGDDLRIMNLSEEEKMFLGMLAGVSSLSPRLTVSKFAGEQNGRKNRMKRIASQLFKIRHWKIQQGCYTEIENLEATWFIDPPYQVGGSNYVHGAIDYKKLALWSEQRNGQAIVCENSKADWMPFYPIVTNHGAMTNTQEVFWTNVPTSFSQLQTKLF